MKLQVYIIFSLLVGVFLWWRYQSELGKRPDPGTQIIVEGVVRSEPVQYRNGGRFQVKGSMVSYFGKELKIGYGDQVRVSGVVGRPPADGRMRLDWSLEATEVIVYQRYEDLNFWQKIWLAPNIMVRSYLFGFRNHLLSNVRFLFAKNSGALVAGMVLGIQSEIDTELYGELQKSGLLHLVVASGGNIILVASVVMGILGTLLRRGLRLIVGYSVVWLYVLLAGAEPPVVRAAILLGLVWVAHVLGRRHFGVWVLFLVGTLMIGIQPLLVTQLSFQLSILATLGLMMFGQYLQEGIHWLSERQPQLLFLKWIEVDLSQTLAAQLLVVPLIFYVFGEMGLFSVVANLLVGFLVAPVMVLGMIVLAVSLVSLSAAQFLAWLLDFLTQYFLAITSFFGSDDIFLVNTDLPAWILWLWWGLLFCFYYKYVLSHQASGD